jgi:hypothetical protein
MNSPGSDEFADFPQSIYGLFVFKPSFLKATYESSKQIRSNSPQENFLKKSE